MSEQSYWRARPVAKTVYDRRVRAENEQNFRILSKGITFSAILFGVFGVCMGNLELVVVATAMAVLSKAIG